MTDFDQPARHPPQKSAASEAVRRGRQALGRSFRLQRSRGPFCHRGWCQQCKVTLADGRVALACELPAAEYAKIVAPGGWRMAFGILARFLPPWFHERVRLPLPWAQNFFHEVVRRATGALPLTTHAVAPGKSTSLRCTAVVVGNGSAGIAAAETLARRGVDVVLVGLGEGGGEMPAQIRHLPRTLAVGIYPTAEPEFWQLLCSHEDGSTDISFQRMVVATGAYDRLLPIPGNDLPGIVGMDALERLLTDGSIEPGMRIGIFAPSDNAALMLRKAGAEGVRVAWVATDAALPSVSGVRIHVGARPLRTDGRSRLRAVVLDNGRTEACDLLVTGYRQPAYEFFLQAGLGADYAGPGEAIRVKGTAAFPILGVGEAAGGDPDQPTAERVEAWIAGRTPAPMAAAAAMPFTGRIPDAVIVCPCEDVRAGELRQAIAAGFDNIEHLKRRTGVATGPCQGKLCHCLVMQCLADEGCPVAVPTMRPLARPVQLARFASRKP